MPDFIFDPVFVGAVSTIVGIIIERFAPQWIPFIGIGKKIIKELVELHDRNEKPNVNILVDAKQAGLNRAVKEISKLI